jgi:hypothetical protein
MRRLDTPFALLTRNFFVRLFDFELLAQSGRGSIAGPVAGVAGVLIALGLLLARVMTIRYRYLHKVHAGDLAAFEDAVLTDHTFLIAVPMWIIAFVAVLIGPSLFPDETDFRILMSMPLTRRLVFGAKLAAVGMVASLFFVIAEVALFPMFLLTMGSPWPDSPLLVQAGAYLASGFLGALFGGLAITAVHALLLLVVPRSRLLPISAAVGSALLFALVMALPLFISLPAFKTSFDSNAAWLYAFPPAWFTGVEQWLRGDMTYARLAASAITALAVVGGIATAAYVTLYRHFARVMARPASDQGARLDASVSTGRAARQERRPAFAGVRAFTTATLRRSVLHQGLFVALSAIGAALVTLTLIAAEDSPSNRRQQAELISTLAWAPFALTFFVTLAIRASLLVPIEGRANWVFRLTEKPQSRPQAIDAAFSVARRLGVVLPCLLLLPLQWQAYGAPALLTTSVAILSGFALVEMLLFDWRRIPFTCSVIIGKGFIPQMLLLGLLTFVGYTTIGSGLAHAAALGPPIAPVLVHSTLATIVIILTWHRRRAAPDVPLEFEDSLPTEASPLRLSGD